MYSPCRGPSSPWTSCWSPCRRWRCSQSRSPRSQSHIRPSLSSTQILEQKDFSIFKGFYCVLRSVRLSDFIKVYGKYWTSQNWSGRNIRTENPANFTEGNISFILGMIFRFKGSKRKRYFSIWGISWIGLLWNVLFTLLYKIDVKQTRIKVYCCDVVDGW